MPEILVDLYSDTVTKPTPAMRDAMAQAEVGDEQKYEDPTTNRLQDMVAALLGREAAVFLPSGTMCNEIALAVHCEAGDEVVIDETAHAITAEAGGPAVVARAMPRTVHGDRGVYSAAQLEAAIRPPVRHAPVTSLAWVEQTSNFGGGTCWKLDEVAAVCDLAHARGLRTHCDGARVMNAVVATGTPAAAFGAHFDSIWLDLSKGLGAPIGGVLAGSAQFIERAWRWKQRLGGAMRQSGIIAAAGVYALEHNVDRLAEDHAAARALAGGLAALPGVAVDAVETNIVFFDIVGSGMTAADLADRALAEHGVRVGAVGPARLRAVTHLDVSAADIDVALEALGSVLRAQ
ncbi:MAG: threonine aldolase [Chloroflexota bacterium]|nr:threonine aldolase [Chloroflexota bacterium]